MDILLISHVRILRDALVAALQGVQGNQARGAFSRETVEAALVAFAPGLVVVDASHPEAATLVATVRAHAPTASVVVLAAGERDEEFLAWADVGISGYLGLDTSANDLLSAVRCVGVGEVACPSRLTALLLNRFASRSSERAERAGIFSLTSREQEIAELLADGLSNKLIARRLCVALPTVKNHVHSILEKWDCRSRGEAAARYRRQVRDDARPSGGTVVELRAGPVPSMGGASSRTGGMQHRMPAAFGQKAA
jgi:two-component system nitrate/nitrite response regulator NarL